MDEIKFETFDYDALKVYSQSYTCENGSLARITIPASASKDDLLGIRDLLDITIKRRFKINIEEEEMPNCGANMKGDSEE